MAADRLVEQIEGIPPEDCLIGPALFLYRHWIELKRFALLEARIKELHKLDPDGYRFRYPVNTRSEITDLPESLGMKNLKDAMDKISNEFGKIDGGIDYEGDSRTLDAELQAEMRSYGGWE